jgi:LysM repeat protein
LFFVIVSCFVIIFGISLVSFGLESLVNYQVKRGDTFWLISNKFGVSMDAILEANKATQKTVLYEGQTIVIPQKNVHIVSSGESYWTISKKYNLDLAILLEENNATDKSVINIGDRVIIPDSNTQTPAPTPTPTPTPSVTYTYYTIVENDNMWKIAEKFGVPISEVLKINNFSETTILYPGDKVKIPQHDIPIKNTVGDKFGEYLDWWKEAQYVVKKGSVFEVVDFYTGKSFFAKRTTGTNHADIETLSINDTNKMKEIWGGNFSWTRRPVIVIIDGRKLAASATAMPHAGNDYSPGGIWTEWRSGGYGAGYNLDWIKENGCEGHTDLHFLNSTRHVDGLMDPKHQANVKISAGR